MFWNREELPIELRDKKPQEIIEALKKLEEFEQKSKDWETSKTDLESKLNTQSTEFEQTKQRLQELEAGIQQAQQQSQQQQQQQTQQPPDIWQDPDKYIDGKIQGPQAAALLALRTATGMRFQQSLQGRERKIFDKYTNEIEQVMNTFHPYAQGVPQNWQTAFYYVKGLHEQDIAKGEQEGSPFFSEPAARGAHEEEQPNPNEKLTAEEEEACRRFHWDPKGYLERKKEMAVHQSERGSYARFPVPQKKVS